MLGQPVSMLDPAGRRLQAHGELPRRRDRDRPRADRHRDAARRKAWSASSSSSTATGLADSAARRPRDDRQHGARVRRDLRHLPDRRRDAPLPAAHRPLRGADRARRGLLPRSRGCSTTPARPKPRFTTRSSSTCRRVEPASPGPKRPQDRVSSPTPRRASRGALQRGARRADTEAATQALRLEGEGRRRHRSSTARPVRRSSDGVGRDRRDHQLHEHLQPVGDGRRRPAREEGRGDAGSRAKPWVKTSLAPGSKVVTEYLDRRRARRLLSTRSASTSSATAARPASATPARCRRRSRPGRRTRATWWSPRCSRATATSRAGSTPTCKTNYLASPPLVVAYALAGTMDIDFDERAARRRTATATTVFLQRHLAVGRRGRADRRRVGPRRRCSATATATCSRETSTGSGLDVPAGERFAWERRTRRTCGSRPTSRACHASPRRSSRRHRRARARGARAISMTTDHISPAGVDQAATARPAST